MLMPSPSAEHRFRNHRTRDLVTPEEGDEDEEDDDSPSVGTTLMAGAVAGAISKTVVAPLERAKIYFMTNEQVRFRLRKMVKWLKFSYRTEVRERYIIQEANQSKLKMFHNWIGTKRKTKICMAIILGTFTLNRCPLISQLIN